MNEDIDNYYVDIPLEDDLDAEGDPFLGYWDFVSGSSSADTDYPALVYFDYGDAPQKLQQLMKTINAESWATPRNKSFYKQAAMMADFEDSADEIVPFQCYYPVYKEMNVSQLRSYFTLRKLWRRGQHPDTSLSYLFVYIYETLMQVGVENPEEGLEILEDLRDGYCENEPKLLRYLENWMRDYVAYYNLIDRRSEFFSTESREDMAAAIFANRDNENDDILFETACNYSTFNVKKSILYKKSPQDVQKVVVGVIRKAAPMIEKREHHRFENLMCGLKRQTGHPMFEAAVFYNPHPPKDYVFSISERRKYICRNGLWTLDVYKQLGKRGVLLGMLLHETDRRLRLVTQGMSKTTQKLYDADIELIIQKVIDDYLKEKAEAARPKIQVDFSKLADIRSDASVIREALLSDEERMEEVEVWEPKPETPELQAAQPAQSTQPDLLDDDEMEFLRRLISGGDWRAFLREKHIPEGVMMDSVNEHLMDEFQDIVLTDNGNGPEVIEDYLEEMKGMIGE